jgi:hypothetical protein
VASSVGLVALYRALSQGTAPARPRFGIVRGAEATCRVPAAAARQRELQVAAWLSFATLGPSAQDRLLLALESLSGSLEARLHPLGFDLLDESPEQIARREAPWLLPIWTAARTISRRCFMSGDRSLCVVVQGDGAPLPSKVASFDPFHPADDDAEQRLARFLCWPISAAVRVRPKARTAGALRERCGASTSTLALVVDGSAQSVDRSLIERDIQRRLQTIRERLSRLAQRKCESCESFSDVIDALSSGLPDAPALDWLELGSGEALAVPRLSAVSQPQAFLRELGELSLPVVASDG